MLRCSFAFAASAGSVALVGAFALSACLPPRTNLRGGERLMVVHDTALRDIPGPSLRPEDHRRRPWGVPTTVVAAGATVQVAPDYQQQWAAVAPHASSWDRNPWIPVVVVDSPIAAQSGWRGWIHLGATGVEVVTAAVRRVALARATILCPTPDGPRAACRASLPAGTEVHPVRCAGNKVAVELWLPNGTYLVGYLSASQLIDNPCKDRSL